MLKEYNLDPIAEPLLTWYEKNARVLPWRTESTPYRVWVSEMMLQQTRVEAVKPYYARFIEELPDIQSLAECGEERLLKLWEGLGYYNRVRHMQEAAQTVCANYGGILPADYESLLSLKGIGSYTAGAIASIAYGIPVPAVDGNVLRVIMRLTADDSDIMRQSVKRELERKLREFMETHPIAPGAFNQALMELGATVCLPGGEPLCGSCPWEDLCLCRKKELWQTLPVRKKAKPRRIEERTVLLIRDDTSVVLRRRPKSGLLAGLYEFPNEECHLAAEEALQLVREMQLRPLHIQRLTDAKHIFSHVEWHMIGYMIQIDSLDREEHENPDVLFAETIDIRERYPIPSAFEAYAKYLPDDKSSASVGA